MAGTLIHITDAGRAALIAAGNTGTTARQVVEIGLSKTPFDDTNKALTALPGEIKRITTFGGANVAPDLIHVTLKDDTADQYTLYGFGLYFENGVLFGVYSQATPIMEKSPAAMLLLTADMLFTTIDAAQLVFGDASFLNPPATTERQGVIELATQDEVNAGADATRALTPKTAAMRYAALTGALFAGAVQIATAAGATDAQLSVKAANGANSREAKQRFYATFGGSIADTNSRLAASIRSGFYGSGWGYEYLDFWLNTGAANDAASDALQSRVMRMAAGGRVMIGGSVVDDLSTSLQVGGTISALYGHQITTPGARTASFSTSNFDGLSIESFNIGNTAKKSISLAPYGGRVLIGTTTDDGASTFQVSGASSFYGSASAAAKVAPSGVLLGTNTGGNVIFRTATAATDQKLWDIQTNLTSFQMRTVDDGWTNGVQWLQAIRGAGNSVSSVQIAPVSGRVLIGKTTDDGSNLLQVAGATSITGGLTTGAGITASGTGIQAGVVMQNSTGSTGRRHSIYSNNQGALVIGDETAGSARISVFPAGRVSMNNGADDGTSQLQVGGNVAIYGSQLNITSTASYAASMLSGPAGQYKFSQYLTNGKRRFEVGATGDAETGANAGSNFYVNRYDDNGNSLSVPLYITRKTGNVLINGGADDGSAALQVNGAVKIVGQILAAEGSVTSPGYSFQNDGAPDTGFFHISDGVFAATNNGVETMRFISGSRVLIGTTTDDTSLRLAVGGNLRATGEIQSGSSNTFRSVYGNYGAFIRNDGSAVYLMQTASGDQYGGYAAVRPFYWNLASGAVNIDGTGASTTFGGPVIVSSGTGTAQPLAIRANAGQQRNLQFQTGTVNRWQIMTDSVSESGLSAGSDFYIQAFNDAGGFLSNPLKITRSTGRVLLSQGLDVATGGNITVSRASGEGQLLIGANDGYFFANATQAGWYSGVSGSYAYNFAQKNLFINNSAVWHAGNLTPGNYVAKSGDTMTGRLSLKNTNSYGELGLISTDSSAMFLRGRSSGGGMEWVNSAYNAVVATMDNGGNFFANGNVYSAGGASWLAQNGDVYGGAWGGYLSSWLNSNVANLQNQINARATAGSQVQWNSGVAEFGSVNIHSEGTADLASPWVMVGLRRVGDGVIYIRGAWLRNQ